MCSYPRVLPFEVTGGVRNDSSLPPCLWLTLPFGVVGADGADRAGSKVQRTGVS